jgi:hypothetical protein
MISTRFCTGAGLKKCSPTTRPGCEVAAEIAVTDRDEVLVARMASVATMPSSARKISCFTGSCSTTASTTRSQAARSSRLELNAIRPTSAPASSSLSFPRLTARAVECSTCWRPRLRDSSLSSTPTTG